MRHQIAPSKCKQRTRKFAGKIIFFEKGLGQMGALVEALFVKEVGKVFFAINL
jgi:hypothetical protein